MMSPIHPRIRERLEQTLAQRLAAYENARRDAWTSVAEILSRLVQLNEKLGPRAFVDLEAECLGVLRALEGFRGPRLPHPADVDALMARVRGIAAMAEAFGATFAAYAGR